MSARDVRAGMTTANARTKCWLVETVAHAVQCAAVALSLGVVGPLTVLRAQPMATGSAPGAAMRLPAIWIGTGVAAGSGNVSSASLGTQAGGMIMTAIELPGRQTAGPARFALRGEGRWSHQSLNVNAGSGISGDVQTLSTSVALRVSPSRRFASSRFAPYVLAGVGLSRPSTRVDVMINNPDMPSARFSQTSSEVAPTGMGGLGAMVRIGRAQLFGEARTEFSGRDAGTLRTSFGTIGIAFQPHY